MNQQVADIINNYPRKIQQKVLYLRRLILSVAQANNVQIEETLKWNDPSYLSKGGSTIRLAWIKSTTDQYGIYFNCKTILVETFKEIYPQDFNYLGNRAIVFNINDEINISKLKHCMQLALTYHSIKYLPLLGV